MHTKSKVWNVKRIRFNLFTCPKRIQRNVSANYRKNMSAGVHESWSKGSRCNPQEDQLLMRMRMLKIIKRMRRRRMRRMRSRRRRSMECWYGIIVRWCQKAPAAVISTSEIIFYPCIFPKFWPGSNMFSEPISANISTIMLTLNPSVHHVHYSSNFVWINDIQYINSLTRKKAFW